jgi:hypothetical protein
MIRRLSFSRWKRMTVTAVSLSGGDRRLLKKHAAMRAWLVEQFGHSNGRCGIVGEDRRDIGQGGLVERSSADHDGGRSADSTHVDVHFMNAVSGRSPSKSKSYRQRFEDDAWSTRRPGDSVTRFATIRTPGWAATLGASLDPGPARV